MASELCYSRGSADSFGYHNLMKVYMRTIVLNQSFEYLSITADAFAGVKLLTKGKATPLALYDRKLRSEKASFEIPAVVQLKEYVRVRSRRHGFTQPSHQNVFVRDKERCAYCNCKLTLRSCTKDHVVPRSKGGPDSLVNVVACCSSCNAKKADRTLNDCGLTLRSDIELRALTDDEKLSVLLKLGANSVERKAWLGFLKESNLTLF